MRRGGDLVGYAGLALLVGALLARVLVPGSGAAALGAAMVGVILFLVYFFRSGAGVQGFLARRSTREGGGVLLGLLLVLGIAVLVNVIGARFRVHHDLTADRIFSLAPETVTALREAPAAPRVTAFYPEGDPAVGPLRSLGEAARIESPDLVFRVVDPERDPVDALRLGLREYATVVEVGDAHEMFEGAEEEEFLTALVRAARGTRPRVAFVQGHGEALPQDRSPTGAYDAGEALHRRGYEILVTRLGAGIPLSDSVDVVVLAGPQVPLTAAEEDSLLAFMDVGGRLLLLLDPAWPVTLERLLDRVGFRFTDAFLTDPDGREGRVIQPTEYSAHPATRVLRDRRVPVVLRGVGEVTAVRRGIEGVRQATLLSSGPRTTDGARPLVSAEARGLAAASEWGAGGPAPGRLVVVGDSDFATQAMFSVLGNGDFFLASVRWLAEEELMIELRPRERTNRPLVIGRQQGRALMIIVVGLLPLAVLAAGTAVWWRRR